MTVVLFFQMDTGAFGPRGPWTPRPTSPSAARPGSAWEASAGVGSAGWRRTAALRSARRGLPGISSSRKMCVTVRAFVHGISFRLNLIRVDFSLPQANKLFLFKFLE